MIFSYQNFDEVFNFDSECSYDEIAVQRVTTHRQALEGLFFDRVLKLLGIKRRV
jgi:protein ELYS